jgi:nucleotide-binding universal stress UspA family protein
MYDSVLIPTDGSEGVERTLEHALDLARRHDATVHALYVVDRRLYVAADDSDQETVRERLESTGEEAVGVIRQRAAEAGLDVETAVREGYPDRDIVEYADEHDLDVVVMGTHGRTGRDRLAHLGSVTERVVENARRPVFVVPIE